MPKAYLQLPPHTSGTVLLLEVPSTKPSYTPIGVLHPDNMARSNFLMPADTVDDLPILTDTCRSNTPF